MKVAIISDTHENEFYIKNVVNQIKKMNIDIVLHCGDLISPPMIEHFSDIKDFKMVFGNNDGEHDGLKKMCAKFNFDEPKDILDFKINNKTFFMAHEPYKIEKAIMAKKYDYILHGHTHQTRDETINDSRIINPGALFRAYYYTFAVLDIETDKLEFIKIKK